MKSLAFALPPCVRSLGSDAEWIVFGAPALRQSTTGTIVLRGRWRQRDVDACFASGDFKANVTKDGAKLYRIGDYGWLDFIDEHTAYVIVHSELDADATHKLVKHGAGPGPHVRDLVARLPVDRAITIVADGAAKDDWSETALPIPTGSDLFGWIRVEKDGLGLDLAVDTKNEAAAKTAARSLSDEISPVIKTLEVARDKATVHLRGSVNDLMIGLTSAAISQ